MKFGQQMLNALFAYKLDTKEEKNRVMWTLISD